MALPWVRIDAGIATHDKILNLLAQRNGRAIAFSYICAIAYSGGNGTDGLIPFNALRYIHATKRDAETLVEADLFVPDRLGWMIRNYNHRQQMSASAEAVRRSQREGALRANCVRWHGKDCDCWKEAI